MAQYRCTRCGNIIEKSDDVKIGNCDACGSLFVFPNNFPQKQGLYRRAADMRYAGNYIAACNNYGRILKVDATETEANWGYLLSKYGVEQVTRADGTEDILFHQVEAGVFTEDPSYKTLLEYCPREALGYFLKQSAEIDKQHKRLMQKRQQFAGKKIQIYLHCPAEKGTSAHRLTEEVYEILSQAGYQVYDRYRVRDLRPEDENICGMAASDCALLTLVIAAKESDFSDKEINIPLKYVSQKMHTNSHIRLVALYQGIRPEDLPMELAAIQNIDCGAPDYREQIEAQVNRLFGRRVRDTELNRNIRNDLARAEQMLSQGQYMAARKVYESVLEKDIEEAEANWGVFRSLTKNLSFPTRDRDADLNYQRALRFASDFEKEKWQDQARRLMFDAVWKDLMGATDSLQNTACETNKDIRGLIERVRLYSADDSDHIKKLEEWQNTAARDRKVSMLYTQYKNQDAKAQSLFSGWKRAENTLKESEPGNYKSIGICLPELVAVLFCMINILLNKNGAVDMLSINTDLTAAFIALVFCVSAAVLLLYTLFVRDDGREKKSSGKKKNDAKSRAKDDEKKQNEANGEAPGKENAGKHVSEKENKEGRKKILKKERNELTDVLVICLVTFGIVAAIAFLGKIMLYILVILVFIIGGYLLLCQPELLNIAGIALVAVLVVAALAIAFSNYISIALILLALVLMLMTKSDDVGENHKISSRIKSRQNAIQEMSDLAERINSQYTDAMERINRTMNTPGRPYPPMEPLYSEEDMRIIARAKDMKSPVSERRNCMIIVIAVAVMIVAEFVLLQIIA